MKKASIEDRLDGIFLLDKPIGISSHSAMKRAQRFFQAAKAGHTGSLDPLAGGMLPICLGEATKFSRFFLEASKAYRVSLQLGCATTTGDKEGEPLVEKSFPVLSEADLNALAIHFLGEQQQIPPMFSALKHQGRPLYKLARQGKTIERAARTITVERLTFFPFETQDVQQGILSFDVECSKGTYIRSLVEQMGEYLGTAAHVIGLHRLWVAPFQNEAMFSLESLEPLELEARREKLLSIQTILSGFMPAVQLSYEQGLALKQGRTIEWEHTSPLEWLSLLCEGRFLGVGSYDGAGVIRPKRLISAPLLSSI